MHVYKVCPIGFGSRKFFCQLRLSPRERERESFSKATFSVYLAHWELASTRWICKAVKADGNHESRHHPFAYAVALMARHVCLFSVLNSYTCLITKRVTKEPPHCTPLMELSFSYPRVSFGSLSRVSKALNRLPSSRQGNRLGEVGAASVLDRIEAVQSR